MTHLSNGLDTMRLDRNRINAATREFRPSIFSERRPSNIEEFEWSSPFQCTLDEVATELGITREQVRMIEQRALRKCRAFCRLHGLRIEDVLAN